MRVIIAEDEKRAEARREEEKREAAENRKRQQEYRRKSKKRKSILKRVATTAGILGLSTSVAIGVTNGVKEITDKPINFRQAMQIGMDPQTDLGISQKSEEKLIRLEDTSNYKESDAYYTLTMINDAFEDVIIDKIVSATNRTGKVNIGTRFEDGGTVEYVTIEEGNTSNMYLKDSAVNFILHEKTIPESMANAIGNYKETQSYIIQIQEHGDEVPLPDTIKKCKDLNDKLNEFAAVKISYDDKNKKFEEHVIRESELDSIAKGNSSQNSNQRVQDASKSSNNEKIQNAVINNEGNENNVQNVNEYNDEYEEDYER